MRINNSRMESAAGRKPALLCAAVSMFLLILAPFLSRSAAPGLQAGGFVATNGKTYYSFTVTNGTSTNTFEIHNRPSLNASFPWVGSITGAYGQSNFLIEVGPEQAMFFRALDCVDCDNDSIPNWRDGNPNDSNVLGLIITILSPTNGATVY